MADRRDGEYGRGSFGSQTGAGPGGWPAEEGAPEAPRSVGSQGKSSSEIARQIGLAMHPEELFSHNTPNLAPSPPSMPHSGNLSAPGLYHSQTRAPPQAPMSAPHLSLAQSDAMRAHRAAGAHHAGARDQGPRSSDHISDP
ncbi:hypothetical protein T484DRAFT_1771355 [Baffinella frigidus]|nr:hypothetical protein T484DRAFT_1771355 [Cryptophyta sp. CCMP2293]